MLPDQTLIYKAGRFEPKSGQAVGIRNGRIAFLGPHSPDLEAKATHKLGHHLLCPGLVNTHTHLPMSLFRGLADNLPLMDWLQNYIFPLERGFLNKENVDFGARLSALELIKSGVTCFFDMYFYNQIVAKALDQAGLRGFAGAPVFLKMEKGGADWKTKALELKEMYKDHERIAPAIAPHAPYTVPPKTLSEAADLSKRENIPLVIHVSESEWEQGEIRAKYNATPVQHLHSLGATGSGSLFVHCVHVNGEDLKIMAETGTSLSYNPESNMKLCSGIAPIGDALEKGVAVGLGTDGPASNNNLNFFGEMDTGAKLQALKYKDKALTAMDMLKMATIGGAKAIGLGEEIGIIEEGRRADFMAVSLDSPAFSPPLNLVSALVYAANGSEVDFVMCEGKVLMEGRELKTLDGEKIFREGRMWAEKIKNFLKSRRG